MTAAFNRGLSAPFLDWWLASAAGKALLQLFKAHDLDVRLRDDYLNAYHAQCSLARVEWRPQRRQVRLSISRKYLGDHLLGGSDEGPGREGYASFVVDDGLVRAYGDAIAEIKDRAGTGFAGPEGLWEERCVRANLAGTPLVVIDRQIMRSGERRRLDILGVTSGPGAASLVAVELKRDLDNRIQHVAAQVHGYMEMLDPDGTGLRPDVARSYRTVCGQLAALGFHAPDPALIAPGMPVLGLVALANYNPKSALLSRTREQARGLGRAVGFCRLDDARLVLPARATWE